MNATVEDFAKHGCRGFWKEEYGTLPMQTVLNLLRAKNDNRLSQVCRRLQSKLLKTATKPSQKEPDMPPTDFPISRRLSLAYWPNPAANESANRQQGDAEVDKLTIGELLQFYAENPECCGPTYCMVTRRVDELLRKLPPHIDDRRMKALAAIEAAKTALHSLNRVLDV